jgi:hypothetical protein
MGLTTDETTDDSPRGMRMSHTSHAEMVHWHCVLATEVPPLDAYLCMPMGFHGPDVW